MERKPLMAALVAVFALAAVVGVVALVRQTSEPAGDPTAPKTFSRVSVWPLQTTIELTR